MEIDLTDVDNFVYEPEEVIETEVKKDYNRRVRLALMLTELELRFGVTDAETLNQIIKI